MIRVTASSFSPTEGRAGTQIMVRVVPSLSPSEGRLVGGTILFNPKNVPGSEIMSSGIEIMNHPTYTDFRIAVPHGVMENVDYEFSFFVSVGSAGIGEDYMIESGSNTFHIPASSEPLNLLMITPSVVRRNLFFSVTFTVTGTNMGEVSHTQQPVMVSNPPFRFLCTEFEPASIRMEAIRVSTPPPLGTYRIKFFDREGRTHFVNSSLRIIE